MHLNHIRFFFEGGLAYEESLKTIAMVLIVSLSVVLIPLEANAKNKTCGYMGCTCSTENCSNGTVFCDIHAPIYAREQGYKVCAVSGCYARACSNSSYCTFDKETLYSYIGALKKRL